MLHDFYLESYDGSERNTIWQFRLPGGLITEHWPPFRRCPEPERTFRLVGSQLITIAKRSPNLATRLRRIIVRTSCHIPHRLRLGLWNRMNAGITQYIWLDGTELSNTSTAQLRIMAPTERYRNGKFS